MESWIDRLAEALGEDTLSEEGIEELLSVTRDVAHRVERRLAPLSTFLLGTAVGRSLAGGDDPHDAMEAAMDTLRSILPASTSGGV